jgi:CRISPR-associated protein (TIGR03984 family)
MKAYRIQEIAVNTDFAQDPAVWLVTQAKQHGLQYLLAHADDGVIWGRVDGETLTTSHAIAPRISPELRSVTLEQCRLFDESGELLIWQDDAGWHARLATDEEGASNDRFQEDQLLWGTAVEKQTDTFTLLSEGAQGLRHAVPIRVSSEQLKQHELRLRVRHYIAYDEASGEARVALSRLVTLLPAQ